MNNKIFILIFVLIVFLAGGFLYIYNPDPENFVEKEEPTVCTTEAKLCPDGSYVGRTGPECQFAQCPTVSDIPTKDESPTAPRPEETKPEKKDEPEIIFCTMDVKICPDGSYVNRSGPKCEFAPCPSPTSQ